MSDYDRIRVVKEAVQARLITLPGVHAVGVGAKMVNGQRTDEPSIVVFLVKKMPLAELPPENVIPAEIDGVKTDVVEMDVPVLQASSGTGYVRDMSRPRPMGAGVSLQAKGAPDWGTLGCFGLTQEAQPKVVAITCQHVVAPVVGTTDITDVQANYSGAASPYLVNFSITGPNAAGSLVIIRMASKANNAAYTAYWTVTAADTPDTLAASMLAAVNAIAASGVKATPGANSAQIVLTTQPGSDTVLSSASVYDPLVLDKEVQLLAGVAGNVITLTGQAADQYGIYTSWNTDGSTATHGAFTPAAKGSTLAAIANSVAASITSLGLAGITATVDAQKLTVTIGGTQQARCIITRDLRVGQPSDSFSSNCSLCCSDHMGQVLNSHQSLDVALVQVRQGLKYLNEIEGDNTASPPFANTVIRGVHPVTDPEAQAHYPVNKRGALSGYTSGVVTTLSTYGWAASAPPNSVFYRFYDNAMVVMGNGGVAFSGPGDSGAAVFDNSGNIVGILFGGSGKTLVTPIALISSELKVTVATSTALNQTQGPVTAAQGAPAAAAAVADDVVLRQVLETHAEVAATPAGKQYADLITRHAAEVQTLVNTNLKVAVVWHRNSGPDLIRALLRMMQARDERLPEVIDGVPLTERLTRIRDALMRYGSPELNADLTRYAAGLLGLTGLTYSQALATLRTAEVT
jgi:hypothetical protein